MPLILQEVFWFVKVLSYTHICRFTSIHTASKRHNNKTDERRLLYKYMYLSLYFKGSKRVTQGLCVRGSWRPNINCNILTPTLMAVNVVSFSFSRCSTGGPEAQRPTLLGAGFLYCILTTSLVPKLHRGSRRLPRPGVAFPTTPRL